jgi:hypothetical protein
MQPEVLFKERSRITTAIVQLPRPGTHIENRVPPRGRSFSFNEIEVASYRGPFSCVENCQRAHTKKIKVRTSRITRNIYSTNSPR